MHGTRIKIKQKQYLKGLSASLQSVHPPCSVCTAVNYSNCRSHSLKKTNCVLSVTMATLEEYGLSMHRFSGF